MRGSASLEIHKLMYLLQEAGEDLRLQYVKGSLWSYSTNLHHVLSSKAITSAGYGDGTESPGKILIDYDEDAVKEAELRSSSRNYEVSIRAHRKGPLMALTHLTGWNCSPVCTGSRIARMMPSDETLRSRPVSCTNGVTAREQCSVTSTFARLGRGWKVEGWFSHGEFHRFGFLLGSVD